MQAGPEPARRTHVWALANQKGGCGKTTTAVQLAAALVRERRRVLLVDLDPQAHATTALGHAPGVGRTLAQVFLDGEPLQGCVRPAPGGVELAPSSIALGEFEALAERRLQPEGVLGRALETLHGRYDWVIVDCPPRADGVLTANAVRAATGVLLVVECGAFALQGALRARRLLAELHADAGAGPDYRVVATLFDKRTRFGRDLLVGMHGRFGEAMLDTAIRESVHLREAAAYGVPVQELHPGSRATRDFAALAREMIAVTGDDRAGLPRPAAPARAPRGPAPVPPTS